MSIFNLSNDTLMIFGLMRKFQCGCMKFDKSIVFYYKQKKVSQISHLMNGHLFLSPVDDVN